MLEAFAAKTALLFVARKGSTRASILPLVEGVSRTGKKRLAATRRVTLLRTRSRNSSLRPARLTLDKVLIGNRLLEKMRVEGRTGGACENSHVAAPAVRCSSSRQNEG